MATQQNLCDPNAQYETDENILFKQTKVPVSAPTRSSENDNTYFECNICLDSAQDPIVTLCGHLYCWPCIYKWLHVQTPSIDTNHHHQNCPVCKSKISMTTLIPLYGRGPNSEPEPKKPDSDSAVPSRPAPPINPSVISSTTTTVRPTQQIHPDIFESQSFHTPQYYGGYATIASSSLGGLATTSFFYPMMTMFEGTSLARIFGSSDTNLFAYPYNHPLMVSSNPRIRRQEVELDRSLNRVTIFLFCCFILCLLLF